MNDEEREHILIASRQHLARSSSSVSLSVGALTYANTAHRQIDPTMAWHAMDFPGSWHSDLAALHHGAGAMRELSSLRLDCKCCRTHFCLRRLCSICMHGTCGVVSHSTSTVADSPEQSCGLVCGGSDSLHLVWSFGSRGGSMIAAAPTRSLA